MLPLWLSQTVLAHTETSKKLEKLNKYWKMLIKNIRSDRKCRANINGILAKMQVKYLKIQLSFDRF